MNIPRKDIPPLQPSQKQTFVRGETAKLQIVIQSDTPLTDGQWAEVRVLASKRLRQTMPEATVALKLAPGKFEDALKLLEVDLDRVFRP